MPAERSLPEDDNLFALPEFEPRVSLPPEEAALNTYMRDDFAAGAMQALLAKVQHLPLTGAMRADLATECYRMADAMLEARNR